MLDKFINCFYLRLFMKIKSFSVFIIAIYLVFIYLAYIFNVKTYILDSIGFILLTVVFYLLYKTLNMNLPIFIMLQFSFILHNLGIFGFYNVSPTYLLWDNLVHFVFIFAFSLLLFNYIKQYMDKRLFSSKTLVLILVVFIASLGVGSITENLEFIGFSALGEGSGGFYFGDGDYSLPGPEILDVFPLHVLGGAWLNVMWDLIFNFMGALSGVLVMILIHYTGLFVPRRV